MKTILTPGGFWTGPFLDPTNISYIIKINTHFIYYNQKHTLIGIYNTIYIYMYGGKSLLYKRKISKERNKHNNILKV